METERMNQRITLQKRITTVDDNGLERSHWEDFYSCWAYVNSISGNEFWAAQAVQSQNTMVFTMRYCKQLLQVTPKEYRLIFREVEHNITHVDIVRYENDAVKIKAIQQSSGVSE